MVQHLLQHYARYIDDLFPQGDQAIKISLSSDIDVNALKTTIEPIGWFVTIEPRIVKCYNLPPDDYLFHVTYSSFRDSITRDGLKPSDGGQTPIKRTYPRRVFFSLTLAAAFEFIPFKYREQLDEKDIDIYRVTVPEGIKFYPDPFYRGKAVWCESPILPKYLDLIRGWRGVKHQMSTLEHYG